MCAQLRTVGVEGVLVLISFLAALELSSLLGRLWINGYHLMFPFSYFFLASLGLYKVLLVQEYMHLDSNSICSYTVYNEALKITLLLC